MSGEKKRGEGSTPQPSPAVRTLPIVTIKGKRYFVDERLREYRAVENPHDRIPMD